MDKGKYRILLVPCGGTVCTTSVINEYGTQVLTIDSSGDLLVRKVFEEGKSDSAFTDCVIFDEIESLGILSEDMTIHKWNILISAIKNKDVKAYDGIIILHGTDTLAYSAALLSLLFKDSGKPVFLVSAGLNPEDKNTNAHDNFKAAVELICCGINPNVYVTYRNDYDNGDSLMYLHLGSRLLQCKSYDSNFYSKGAILLPDMITDDLVSGEISDMMPKISETSFDERISIERDIKLKNCILKIEPYVGLDYSSIDCSKYKAVLHGTYHSGTVCVSSDKYEENSILQLINNPKRDYDIYISPSEISKRVYAGVEELIEHGGASFVYGLTNEMVYAKLLIAYSMDFLSFETISKKEINDYLNTDIAGEIIY